MARRGARRKTRRQGNHHEYVPVLGLTHTDKGSSVHAVRKRERIRHRETEGRMLARDLMSPNPAVVVGHDLIAHAAEIMRDRNVGFIPVVTDTTYRVLRGVITDRDIAVRCVALGHTGYCRVAEHMTPTVDTVRPTATINDVVAKMAGAEVRRLVVADEYHRPIGIISVSDLALKLGPKDPIAVETLFERLAEYAEPLQLPPVPEVLGDPLEV